MNELAVRAASGIVMIIVAVACLWFGGWPFRILVAVAAFLMAGEWLRLTSRAGAGLRWFGLPYLILPVIGLLLLRDSSQGFALTFWTFLIVWGTDIGAYFTGRAIGGPKLAPAISPSKTWSGLIGGMIAAGLIGAFVARHFDLPAPCVWLGAPLAILAQAGDFFESWLKRRAGVKDSGAILPGHGGALDRLDGLVPVASVMGLLLWSGLL